MKILSGKSAVTITAALACAACTSGGKSPEAPPSRLATPDMILYGGPIYTGLDNDPTTDAVAVEEGVIVSTGNRELLLMAADHKTEIIDLKGAAMFPGFQDAHAHFLGIGMRELTLNLEDVRSIAELVSIVASNVQHTGEKEPVYGRGWIETGWPEGRMPTRDDLDPVSGDNPVLLRRADGHAMVVNSTALAAAGITDETPDPEGGRIERDASGAATGILIDRAMDLVAELIAAPSEEKKREAYRKGSQVYAAYGWTGLHNMSVDPDDLDIMETLSDAGDVGVRVYNSIDDHGLADLIARGGMRASKNGRIVTKAIKLYMDGALGSRGALLTKPYSDAPDTKGLLLMQKAEAMALFEQAIAAGVQVNTHAIGDEGNKLLLDWYEEIFAKNPDADDLRWRIEHAQILHVEDIARFKTLGVIPSMQPSHAIGDLFFAPDRLGPDRLDGAYAWRALIDAGVIIAGGSDAPVERGDPLIEFYAAVERRGLDGTQTEDWRAEQAVKREEALKMFTAWPAYASFQEDSLGTIEAGKRADFTVFSKDLMQIPASEILDAEAVLTIVDGEVVFRKD